MRWRQLSRSNDYVARPFAQDGPWNRVIPANATYTAPGAGWATLAWGLSSWGGDFYSVTPYQASASDTLFNVRYLETWTNTQNGTWLRQGNTLTNENTIISQSATSYPFDMNGYSTTVATNPQTQTKPSASQYNVFTNPGTLPFQVRVPAGATPSPGLDGHMIIAQSTGLVFEAYGVIKVTQAQNALACVRYHMIDPSLQGDAWCNGLTASMCSVMSGVLRNSEINFAQTAGTLTIPHAMKIAVPAAYLSTATPVYPALAMDRGALTESPAYNGTYAQPMGTRLAIPYSTNLSARGTYLTNIGQAIATAAQRHGFIITDRGGGGVTVFNERFPTDSRLTATNTSVDADVQWVFDNLQRVTSAV